MKYIKTIKISKEEAEQINKHLHVEPTCADECLGEDITISHTAIFDNDFEMDIKCCGVQYDEDSESNTAWTEAVLFHNGSQICYSEPDDEYIGAWSLDDEYGNEYVVIVEVEDLQQAI